MYRGRNTGYRGGEKKRVHNNINTIEVKKKGAGKDSHGRRARELNHLRSFYFTQEEGG